MPRTAVFSCRGLGDGMITLTLSTNLAEHGEEVVTFHPFFHQLKEWFPQADLRPHPETFEGLQGFDRFIFFYETSMKMLGMIRFCEENFPDRTFVLNPIATTRHDIPYWEVGRFDGAQPLVHNILKFCKEELGLERASLNNGIQPLSHLTFRKEEKRVIIHPLSSGDWKNWSKSKFIHLAHELKLCGFDPVFLIAPYERAGWEEVEAPLFSTLSDMVSFVYESGYLIGNDSGVGHLASSLGIPTVTICRNIRVGTFWRPVWSMGELVAPPRLIPNPKGLRLRDRHWKKWITTTQVLKAFHRLRDRHEICCL
jgi:heptosyltransferase III